MLDLSSKLFAPLFRLFARPFFLVRDWFCLTSLRARLGNGVPADLQFTGPVEVSGTRMVTVGRGCRFGKGVTFDTTGEGAVSVGEQVTLNSGVFIVAHAGVSIGDRCLFGEYASIRDADHGTAPDQSPLYQQHVAAEIRIGSDVWVGRGAVILKGVTIGNGAVVAANAVVNRNVEAGCVVAGVPARVVRNRLES